MKNFFFNKRIFTLSVVFSLIFLARTNVRAQELLSIYPHNVSCNEKLNIGLASLNPKEAYQLVIECADLACNEFVEPSIKSIENKRTVSFSEGFNINGTCSNNTTQNPSLENATDSFVKPTPAGKYNVKLLNKNTQKTIKNAYFSLLAPQSTMCELSTRQIVLQNHNSTGTLTTSKPCVYNMYLVGPKNIRNHLLVQFVNANVPFSFNIDKTLLTTTGNYTLTAIADKQCAGFTDRECTNYNFKVIDNPSSTNIKTGCVHSLDKPAVNCGQCQEAYICNTENECIKDALNKCGTKSAQNQSSANQNISFVKKYVDRIKMPLVAIGVIAFLSLLMLFIFLVKQYKIKLGKNNDHTSEKPNT